MLARKLYEQAVAGRSIGGALNLGRLLLDSDDATERCRGADLLQRIYSVPKSLETGVKRVAAAGWAYAYLLGRGVETDIAKGVALLEEADFKQDTDSHTLYLLGRTYESGWGGHAPDAKRAYDYYRRASELDNPKAWWRLGMAFLNGSGVEADPVEAYRRVRMAGEADDARREFHGSDARARPRRGGERRRGAKLVRARGDQGLGTRAARSRLHAVERRGRRTGRGAWLGLRDTRGRGRRRERAAAHAAARRRGRQGSSRRIGWRETASRASTTS